MTSNPLLRAATAALRTLRTPLARLRERTATRNSQAPLEYRVFPLEQRAFINSPVSPGLIISEFGSGPDGAMTVVAILGCSR